MKAYNIDWDVDEQDTAYDILSCTIKEIANILCVNLEEIINQKANSLCDFIINHLHHRPGLIDDFYRLPNSVEIPEKVVQEIEEWHPYYGRCETCKYYANCNACSNCIEGSEYDFDLKHIDNQYITDWLSDEYGFCIQGYKLDTDKE